MARYCIDPARSRVWIDAQSSLHPIHTETSGLHGWVEVDVEQGGQLNLDVTPSGHLELPVDRLRSGNALEDRELQRRIDARRYPTIEGDLTAMRPSDEEGHYLVEGNVAFTGTTRSYGQEMIVDHVDDHTIRLSGHSTFDVRDFGLSPPRILMFKVEPEVSVRVEIIAEKDH